MGRTCSGHSAGFDPGPYVPADPCQWQSTMPDSPATTVDEIVAALASQATRDASEPVDVTVDGHPGMSITLHVPGDIPFSAGEVDYTDCDENHFCTFGDGDGLPHVERPGPGRHRRGVDRRRGR